MSTSIWKLGGRGQSQHCFKLVIASRFTGLTYQVKHGNYQQGMIESSALLEMVCGTFAHLDPAQRSIAIGTFQV